MISKKDLQNDLSLASYEIFKVQMNEKTLNY